MEILLYVRVVNQQQNITGQLLPRRDAKTLRQARRKPKTSPAEGLGFTPSAHHHGRAIRLPRGASSWFSPRLSQRLCVSAGNLRHRRLEVGLCQFGLLADGPAPETAGVVFLAQRHHGVPEIEKGFGELRVLVQRLLIERNRVLGLAALLADQSGVVEQFGPVLAEFDEAAVLLVGVVEILHVPGKSTQ